MRKQLLLCSALLVGICLTEGCRAYRGYREYTETEDAGIENRRVLLEEFYLNLKQDSGCINAMRKQQLSWTRIKKKNFYREYFFTKPSGSGTFAHFIVWPLAIAFSPLTILAYSSEDVTYNKQIYHYSYGRQVWNELNPFIPLGEGNATESMILSTETIRDMEKEEVESPVDGIKVKIQYTNMKKPLELKTPFSIKKLAKNVFEYAFPIEEKSVSLIPEKGESLKLSLKSSDRLPASEAQIWTNINEASPEEMFSKRNTWLTHIEKWEKYSLISSGGKKQLLEKMRNNIKVHIRAKFLNTQPSVVESRLQSLLEELDLYQKDNWLTAKEHNELANSLKQIAFQEQERRERIMYPMSSLGFKPQKLYKQYRSGYSLLAYLMKKNKAKNQGTTAQQVAAYQSRIENSCKEMVYGKAKYLAVTGTEPMKKSGFFSELNDSPLAVVLGNHFSDKVQGFFAYSPIQHKDAYLIGVSMEIEGVDIESLIQKFKNEYSSLETGKGVRPFQKLISRSNYKVVGDNPVFLLQNKQIEIGIISSRIMNAELKRKTKADLDSDEEQESRLLKQAVELAFDSACVDAITSGDLGTALAGELLREKVKDEQKTLFSKEAREEMQRLVEDSEKEKKLVIFIYDKLLLAKLAGEYEVYQKIEAEKQRKAEEERKRKNLAF